MSAKKNNQPQGSTPDDAGAEGEKKERPETIADFMALDTVIGAVSSKEDGYDGPPVSMDTGKQFTEILWRKYQREQETAKRRKHHSRR